MKTFHLEEIFVVAASFRFVFETDQYHSETAMVSLAYTQSRKHHQRSNAIETICTDSIFDLNISSGEDARSLLNFNIYLFLS